MKETFRKAASRVSNAAGNSSTFLGALLIVIIWALSGRFFNYSNTWQLVINTGTTIVTFLMVFLIQNTQNRDSKAMHLKLDEIIRASTARNSFIDLEDMTDEDLAMVSKEFSRMPAAKDSPAFSKLHQKFEEAHRHRSKHKKTS